MYLEKFKFLVDNFSAVDIIKGEETVVLGVSRLSGGNQKPTAYCEYAVGFIYLPLRPVMARMRATVTLTAVRITMVIS